MKENSNIVVNGLPNYDIRIEFQNVKLYWDIEKTNLIQRLILRLIGIKISKYGKEK